MNDTKREQLKERIEEKLPIIAKLIFICWVILQLILIFVYRNTPQFSDAADYNNLAIYCFENNTFYPTESQTFSRYIFNPGYVNYLLCHLHLFGSLKWVNLFNILLNILIVIEIYILGKHFFNKTTASLAIILFCLLPSNIYLVQTHLTEIPFLAITLGAACLIKKNNYAMLMLAGILLCLANWVRPIVIVFMIPIGLYMLINKFNIRSFVALLTPFFLTLLLIGSLTKLNSGLFIFQASTGGYNLMQGANDDMNGGYGQGCYDEGKIGFIEEEETLNFAQRDSIWKKRSLQWIMENPVKYISYTPVKFIRLWWGDDYLDGFLKGEVPFYSSHPDIKEKIKRFSSGFLFSISYYFILVFFILGVIKNRKKMNKNQLLLFTPLILGTLMQILIYGTQRYHHPYMPIIILFAAWWLSSKLTYSSQSEEQAEVNA